MVRSFTATIGRVAPNLSTSTKMQKTCVHRACWARPVTLQCVFSFPLIRTRCRQQLRCGRWLSSWPFHFSDLNTRCRLLPQTCALPAYVEAQHLQAFSILEFTLFACPRSMPAHPRLEAWMQTQPTDRASRALLSSLRGPCSWTPCSSGTLTSHAVHLQLLACMVLITL